MTSNHLCESPKISVVIPVYNGENYLAETVESVLAQTFEDFELIIVDNCSTDATPGIAQKYAEQDDRVVYYKNERNLGMVGNWNRAVLLARDEYIKLLCADDVIEPEHLQAFVNVLDTHPNVSLVTSFEQLIGDLHTVRKLPYLPAIGELDGRLVQKHLLTHGNWVGSPSSVMFRRRDIYVGVFNHAWRFWMLDVDMWIRLLAIGNLYVVPRILTHNRIHSQRQSAVGNINFTFIKEELMLAKFAFQFPQIYGSHTKSEQEFLYCRLLNRLIREGFGKRDLQSLLMMIQIGLGYGRIRFCKLIIKYLFCGIIYNRNTRKIMQLLPAIDSFSLHDLFWRRKFGYKRDSETIDVGYGTVFTHGVIQVPLNVLRAPIHTPTGIRLMPIEETPHYQWIKALIEGNDDAYSRSKYREYVETFFPEEDTDAQLAKIVSLVSSFQSQSNGDSLITIVTHPPTRNRGSDSYVVIYDGVHQSAIAKALGHTFIQCRLVSERWMPPNNLNIFI